MSASTILVTGASGKTGRAVLGALKGQGHRTRAFVRSEEQAEGVARLGSEDLVVGDLRSAAVLARACEGMDAVYHICPNVHPEEVPIGEAAIAAAREAGVEHFVYHSVHLPRVEDMPHHWLKHQVEERLRVSGLSYTILQPCAYMQNVLAQWDTMKAHGAYRVPYDVEAPFSLVDLDDVAEAAAAVLSETAGARATYELCGPQSVSSADVALAFGRILGRQVRAERVDVAEWEAEARSAGLGDYQVDALARMFAYYDRHGFVGDAGPLAGLLGRPPGDLDTFAARALSRAEGSDPVSARRFD